MSELPIVIDVEASGFGRGSYPIEIGLAMPDDRTHCFLVRPAPGWTHWDPAAEAVHRIRRDILQSHGRSVDEVAEHLNAILDGRTVYSDAWGHDSSWIALLFEEADRTQRFRVEALRGLLSDPELAAWHARRGQIERSLGATRHRASVDALVIQRTFVACRSPTTASPPGS